MIVEAIAGSLPMAVGIAISPIPVTAVMMTLTSTRARTNAPAFLLGWMLGILLVGFVVFLLPGIETARGEPTALSAVITIILGIALLFLSIRQWRQRIAADEPAKVPKVLARLDQMRGSQSLVTGFLFSSVNLKNLFLSAVGAATVDASMLGPAEQFIALLVFSAIASLTIAAPVAVYLLAGHRAEAIFGTCKNWLIRNNANMIIVLLLVFGALLIGQGMNILVT